MVNCYYVSITNKDVASLEVSDKNHMKIKYAKVRAAPQKHVENANCHCTNIFKKMVVVSLLRDVHMLLLRR